jgi:CHAD domain-containing protein
MEHAACLHQLVGTLPAMQGGNPEGLRQMRVALRHLRTAISLFADLWSTHRLLPFLCNDLSG